MHENSLKRERVFELGNNLAIYKAHLDSLREQDKNARVMSGDVFKKLVANIQKEHRLESLPFCVFQKNKVGNVELAIMSGHHRTRAAKAAGLTDIYVLVDERELSVDQVAAKQIAHNSINGQDDKQKLAELYSQIKDIEAKIEAAIDPKELEFKVSQIKVEDLRLKMDFEIINILFLPYQKEEFENVVKLLTADVGENVWVAEQKAFGKFKKSAQKVAKAENIRNMTAILYRMLEIVKAHYDAVDAAKAKESENDPVERTH